MKAVLKKRSEPKKLVRTFRIEISDGLLQCKNWTRDVIEGIENDRLLLLNTDMPFSMDLEPDGSVTIDSRYQEPVSIKEWLPIACQNIRMQSGPKDDFDRPDAGPALYRSNAGEVLFPCGVNYMPPGPAAFHGEIVFASEFIWKIFDDPKGEDKFKFVVAHELVHVLNFLRILVPAFQNWERYWNVFLGEGCACDEINQQWLFSNVFVDSYGEEAELAMISEFWPKNAKRWFDAFRQ